ncbi:hypothetical protein PCCS19_59320 [Paenibacillus sp. CCS19]|nr:hypothetical protein PCCS19_59320 [Paenibacillus cellulosilyticus]
MSQPHLIIRKPDSKPIKCVKPQFNDAPTTESGYSEWIKCVTSHT